MGKQQSTLRNRVVVKSRADPAPASTPTPIPSMVWSGGNDWFHSKAQIVALASVLPTAMSSFKPWTGVVPGPVTPTEASNIIGKLILSIGGSNAGPAGWSAMAQGGVDNWVGYFKNLFLSSGLQGIDWDLEQIVDPANPNSTIVWDFIGQVSQQLKAAGNTITFTFFGNNDNPAFPPAWFLQKYADACTYAVLMLYNGGQWTDASWGSWCKFYDSTYAALPPALQSKVMMALYPSGGAQSCCAPCIQQAVDNVRAGKGAGIAFWCYGGWLGACGEVEAHKLIVAAWVDVLNSGGGSGVGDFLSAFPSCSGATATDGCGKSVTPEVQYYSCSGSSCNPNPSCTATAAGCYDTSTCNNACSVANQPFKCTGITCSPDASGPFPNQSACQLACPPSSPQMYACNCGACGPSPTGTYSTSNCDGQCTSTPTLPCSSMGMPVPAGGSCSDPSAQFTCNGQPRCCCLGSVPSPSATNPTSCSAPAAAMRARYHNNYQRYPF